MSAKGIARWLPGVDVLRQYRRKWLWPDIRAGIVVTALLIPAGMGYAVAAGLPPETGLYATIIPLLAYAVFGPSRILVLGPDSALAPIIAASILPLALGDDSRAVALAGLLAIMVGVLLLLGGILRLGFVTDLLSKPIRVGYLNAVALLVIISQVPRLLGFSIDSVSPLQDVAAIVEGVVAGEVQLLAMLFGVASLIVIVVLRWVRSPVPGVLVVVVVATAITAIFGLSGSLPVVGALPQGLPAPALGGLEWADVAVARAARCRHRARGVHRQRRPVARASPHVAARASTAARRCRGSASPTSRAASSAASPSPRPRRALPSPSRRAHAHS